MKKRLTAALCALLVLCTVLSVVLTSTAAQKESLYFMAVNDTVLDLADETMPRMIGGELYVPYTMFDPNATNGASLGVFSVYNRARGTLMIYARSKTLVFDLTNETATFDNKECQGKAVIRNSMVFVPVDMVCGLFDLTWSWIVMERGYVIRVKNNDVVLPDRDFANAATYAVEGRYQKYLQGKVTENPQPESSDPPASSSPVVTPPPEVTTTPSVPGDVLEAEDARVYLGVRMESGEGFEELLSRMKESGVFAVFFCGVEELAARDDQIRALLAGGHRIGLILDADTVEGQLEQYKEGNRLLARIAHMETAVCMSENLTRAQRTELEKSVCLWQTTLNGRAEGRTQTRQVNAVVENIFPRRTYFVLLDDSRQSARALASILSQLMEEGAEFYLATEVTLQN